MVSSGLEVPRLRAEVDHALITVCPGIRPIFNDAQADLGDQQRVLTPGRAIANGADFLVVGRPIKTAPNPADAAEAIQAEIATAVGG